MKNDALLVFFPLLLICDKTYLGNWLNLHKSEEKIT